MRLAKDEKPDFFQEQELEAFEQSAVTHIQSMCRWLEISEEEFPVKLHVANLFSYIRDVLIERENDND